MTCRHCGSESPAGKKFCGDCGAALEHRCPQCSAQNPANKRFCADCGAPLGAAPAPVTDAGETRKVVTVVFADLAGSTSLHERLDAESVRRMMDGYHRTVRSVVEAHDGTVVKLLGDGVMAAFGVPHVAEDDAVRAVRAAVAMVEAVAANGLSVRVGVNTGEVVVSSDNADVVGDPVNVAARLQQEARNQEVVIGESTCRLVHHAVTLAPVGRLALKGRSDPVLAVPSTPPFEVPSASGKAWGRGMRCD